ncbi:hypothetical protein [Paenibacillus sp. KS-LC4]|uniref:hypothetical protein n=1 Tax=Paenibacillus sp. KS-LC4 TaxID=2979727 RepID=UPI0030CCAB69
MNEILTFEQLREALHKLFNDAGYTNSELLETIELLAAENDRLKQEVKKWRLAAARGAAADTSMNSRLKDALRE